MPIELKSPHDLEWNEGDLPDVHSVPYNCIVLVWVILYFDFDNKEFIERAYTAFRADEEKLKEWHGKFSRVFMMSPWRDILNSLRWRDNSSLGIRQEEKVVFWAWIYKGDKK